MKTQISTLIALFIISISIAQKPNSDFSIRNFYEIDASHSYMEFAVPYMGYAKVKGRFAEFNGAIHFDENDILKTSISLFIKVESIDSDLEWRDKDLKSDAWLDAEKFPQMSFQSKKIIKKGKAFDVVGDLTIRDVKKEVTISMNPPSGVLSDTRGDSQVIFSGNLSIDRTDFGVEGKRWSKVKEGITGVGNIVDIEVSVLGKRMNENNLKNWFRKEDRAHSKVYNTIAESGIAEAIEKFKSLKETDKWVKPTTLRLVGALLLRRNRPIEALEIFKANAEAYPENSDAYLDLGEGYAENNDLENAKQAYQKSLTIDPQNVMAMEVLRQLK